MGEMKIPSNITWKQEDTMLIASIKGKKITIDTKKLIAIIDFKFQIKGKSIEDLKSKVVTFLN